LTLKRYTELPYVLQILQSQQLTLLNPNSWDDQNDAHYIKTYREKKGYGSVLALCLTEAAQTYHHWKVFTHGASGACIYFNDELLIAGLKDQGVVGKKVEYFSLAGIKKNSPTIDDLPFIKRSAYEHEDEFRLLYATKKKSIPFQNFTFPCDAIHSIVLNPWLPRSTFSVVKNVINGIKGFENLDVLRATIIENDTWRKIASNCIS
jgi:hypothetical protein